MTPSYQVISDLAGLFATQARPRGELLDEAASIIGHGAGVTCLIGVRVTGAAVFAPVGVHHHERPRQALMSDTAWPVSRRAERVLASGRPFLGGTSTAGPEPADPGAPAPWRDGGRATGELPHMMLAIRSTGVGVGVVVIARERPGRAYTEADAREMAGPLNVLAMALGGLTLPSDTWAGVPAVPRAAHGAEAGAQAVPIARHADVATLNGREREVITLMALGLTTAEIGATMYLSARTVEWYRRRIRRKLDGPTRAELVALGRGFTASP